MDKEKFKASIFFTDLAGEHRFLFKIINYGKDTDELKFIFNHPKSYNAVIFNEQGTKYPEESVIRSYGEVSYHSDGSLLWKLPETPEGQRTVIDNPHGTGSRRTPLSAIKAWEPVVLVNIIRYNNCFPELTDDAKILPSSPRIFNGDPFEYHIFLGHMRYGDPPNSGESELIFRVNDIGQDIDMMIWVRKSDYSGEPFKLGKTTIWNNNNRIRISEPRLQIKNGAVEIDLGTLWSAGWNEDVVGDDKRINLVVLRGLAPMTAFGKAYLRDNPYLNQLINLVGFNKGFAVAPLFNGQPLSIELVGILDKDEKGEFLGFGTRPAAT